MQGTQYATKRSILCRGAFCGPTCLPKMSYSQVKLPLVYRYTHLSVLYIFKSIKCIPYKGTLKDPVRLCISTVSPNLCFSLTQIPKMDLHFVSLSLSKGDSTVQFCSNATPLLPLK